MILSSSGGVGPRGQAQCDDIIEKARASTSNLRFAEAQSLAERIGFTFRRVKGSHRVYTRPGTRDILNLQPGKNGKAKSRQVEQLLKMYENLRPEECDTR